MAFNKNKENEIDENVDLNSKTENEEESKNVTDTNEKKEVENGTNSETKEEANKYLEQLQRTMAEFDNYKKRTLKEKQELYNIITGEIISSFLPVIDNIENAIKASNSADDSMTEGVKLILKQIKDILASYEVEEIVAVGEHFNPELHDAVMHIDDENYEENIVIEELRKGYKCKNKVIRHSMVKVAN